MGMFSRFSDIVQANINAMLDKAEDPQKMLALIVSEMEGALGDLRSIAAKYLAEQKSLQRKVNELEKKSAYWQQNAELAMSKGREDLAKSALIEKQSLQNELTSAQEAAEELNTQLQQLRDDADRLSEKLAEAKAKQKSMQMRYHTAQARLNVKVVSQSDKIEEVMSRFDHYQHRIDDLEAKVDAYDIGRQGKSLRQEFIDMEQEEKLNEELEALRKKVA
ncbi:phage shock protein PspA [Paraneptunicella aestuarii]|uniref:phage shock protein PspA n=1 Tax=Paraneptunicella aestuarii TaxID=2831148 RepID=UPI001E540E34|nr:phage shock protein PspA [Paraneptunicella aestuarii]UAA39344.1 phage shock protein PspA [Paraneptunicella aestuarii]